MVDYREILRLHDAGHSIRTIANLVQSSRDTVATTLAQAKAAGITWSPNTTVTNEELQALLFPGKYTQTSPYTAPDCPWIHRELARKGVTLTLLWTEYCEKTRANGGVPYGYTQFCEKYRRWARVTKATMRIEHKPGDAMQVDWAGDPLYITDPVTGEEYPAFIFVAVLPCSWYTYAEVCSDMKSENWLNCHVNAYSYFGGVPRLLIPDNAKTGVTFNSRYETVLNRSYQELADHYGTAIVPARVRKPDDKAAAEGTVRFVSIWITAALRDRKLFSVAEAREALAEKLEELNRRPFRKRPGCRLSAFEQEEKAFLHPLPICAFELASWVHPKVGTDYLVTDGRNKYSVPFDLIGETVAVRLTRNMVEVYYKQTRVALHVRLENAQREPVVKPEHMPESHRKYLRYNAKEFQMWAAGIGPETSRVVQYFLNHGKEVEQGFKPCASLTKLAERYGAVALEDACGRVLKISSSPAIRNIATLCKSVPLKKSSAVELLQKRETGQGITRGADYYSKGGRRHD